ncbi:MAG: ROK family protein [Thermoplasmata archaeon]|nr:ROK family protein [Thermoplasmata archaeon]
MTPATTGASSARAKLPAWAPVLGIDLGGTKVATAVVDGDGRLHGPSRRLVRAKLGPAAVLEDIVACAQATFDDTTERPVAAGIGVAGQVDGGSGIVHYAPNLRWRGYPLGPRLARSLRIPVTVVNDVRAATLAEWVHGAGRGSDDIVGVFVGTGVGGGVVSGGRLLEGASNAAGELGHMTLVAGGRKCHCPSRGCVEAYVGGWAIAQRAQEAVRNDPPAGKAMAEIAGRASRITAATVSEARRHRDPLALAIDRDSARFLADGLIGFVNAFNPHRVILGGGILDHSPHWVGLGDRAVRRLAQPPAAHEVRVVPAALGNESVVVGASLSARRKLAPSPVAHSGE